METINLNEKAEKIIEDIKQLKVVTYDEVLNEDNEKPLLDCIEVGVGVFVYNAGQDLFIIQDLYADSIKRCNTPYLMAYIKEHL